MKIILFAGFLLVYVSDCRNISSADSSVHGLPNNEMINEVFYFVSKIDSFDYNYSISEIILKPKLYKLGMVDPDSVSPFTHISYDELFLCFGSSDSLQKRYEDSLYIKYQFDSKNQYKLSEDFISHFNQKAQYYYKFTLPIFNSSLNNVEISYMIYANDTLYKQQVLERIDSGWIEKKFDINPSIME